MNEKAWSDFEKTGSVADYLNYKLGESIDEEKNISKKLCFSAGSFDNADKDKGNSSKVTGL